MQGYKLQHAKLNLFADKRLCHRDSSKCLSGFVYVIFDTTNPMNFFTQRLAFHPVSSYILQSNQQRHCDFDERFRNSFSSCLILTQGMTLFENQTVTVYK